MANIGIIDADLIGRKKHRFPNLACMKIAGWHRAQGDDVRLETVWSMVLCYDKVYVSKAFTDTPVDEFYINQPNVTKGGTGFFFDKAPPLPDEIEHHMPYYDLYGDFIKSVAHQDKDLRKYDEYTDYSIGFLTRGCFRKCPFCVNQKYDRVFAASPLKEFYDPSRPKICLLDDNFLGYSKWRDLLKDLKDTGRKFKFKQGLDARLLTDEKCEMLFTSRYDENFTFAFDNVADYDLIHEKLQLIRRHTANTNICFYVFTGFDRNGVHDEAFWHQDLNDLFRRLELLIRYHTKPYVMRHMNSYDTPYAIHYARITDWANQPKIMQKMSFSEYIDILMERSMSDEQKEKTKAMMESLEKIVGKHYLEMKYGE